MFKFKRKNLLRCLFHNHDIKLSKFQAPHTGKLTGRCKRCYKFLIYDILDKNTEIGV